ncbi:MAG: hypothetical protein R2706_19790 [Acidimicrobiales bacterium]
MTDSAAPANGVPTGAAASGDHGRGRRAVEVTGGRRAAFHLDRCGSLATTDEVSPIGWSRGRRGGGRLGSKVFAEAVRYRQRAVAARADKSTDLATVAEVLLALGSAQTAAGSPEGRASMIAAADAATAAGRWDDLARAALVTAVPEGELSESRQ